MAKTKEEIVSWLKQHQSSAPSDWSEEAAWERENRAWIRHSQYIAVKMLSKMDELHMSQRKLADEMGCSQQYISKILKGKENLSLETISKIEKALDLHIIGPNPYIHSQSPSDAMVADNSDYVFHKSDLVEVDIEKR